MFMFRETEYGAQVLTNKKLNGLRKGKVYASAGSVLVYEYVFDYTLAGFLNLDTNDDGTADAFASVLPVIESYSNIKKAQLFVLEAFTTGSSAALNIGTYQQNGTVIDADGIDAAIAVAALTRGAVIDCDGAQVGASIGANGAYINATPSTGSFTAGKALLRLEVFPSNIHD